MEEMTSHQRFHAVMNGRPFDRLPVVEWAAWWDQTIERWHGEGLLAELTDRYEICRHFGLEVYPQEIIWPLGPDCPSPESHGAGILKNRDDYERLRPHMLPEEILFPSRVEKLKRWREMQERGEAVVWITMMGYFAYPRKLFGIEKHLYAFYDHPHLMRRMNRELAEWHLYALEQVGRILTPDFMTFMEDMSYNHGPMLSREQFEEFMAPYYRLTTPRLRQMGTLSFVDSDGDVTEAAPWFAEAGIDGMLPMERQAGVDAPALLEELPEMQFIGGFDKMTMWRGEEAMRREFERLLPAAADGRLIISCDHQTPPQVSYDDYRLYLRLFREYAERAGRMSRRTG